RAPPPHGRGTARRDVAGGSGGVSRRRGLSRRSGDGPPDRAARERRAVRVPARRLSICGRGSLVRDRGRRRRGVGTLRRLRRVGVGGALRDARRTARGTRRDRREGRRVDAGAERRGCRDGAPDGRRVRDGRPERRRPSCRRASRCARRARDGRASRDRPRAPQRQPAPLLADAARATARGPVSRRRHRRRPDPRPRPSARRGRAPRRGRRLPVSARAIRDRAAIVGIGQTAFSKSLGRSEYDMALEAIVAACDDAGISPRDLDGTVRYDMETTDEENLLAALGNPCLRWFASSAWGGGGAASVIVLAATAIAAGMASTVLVYRSRARGKASVYGAGAHQGGRYWERLATALPGLNQWHVPH